MIVDSHAHLLKQFYSDDILNVCRRCQDLVVNIVGFDIDSSQEAVELAKVYPNFYASCGIHPNEAYRNFDIAQIERLAQMPKVISIGEIGLDYYRDSSPKQIQFELFRKQIEIAQRFGLPYVVHSREAFADTLDVIKDSGYNKCVMHSFDYDSKDALSAVEAGCYISFSGMLTFKNKGELKEAAKSVPLEKVLFETDSPFLSPVPFRGKTNEPQYVKYVYEEFSRIRGIDPSQLEEQVFKNFKLLFSKSNE
ncbi:MAG: TatD family hydrolase [Caldisericaceae bacterium]